MRIRLANWIPVKYARHMTEEEIRSEQQIVEQAKEDAQYFAILYDRYFEGIFYFIYRRMDDEAAAADLASQTFYRALKKLAHYKNKGLPFSAWLYRIAANEVNNYYRKSASKRIFSLEEERVIEIMEEAGEESNEEKLQVLVKSLNELPTDIIEIMELRFFEEKSFKEIAYILGISESSAKMRIYRTLKKLREIIDNEIRP